MNTTYLVEGHRGGKTAVALVFTRLMQHAGTPYHPAIAAAHGRAFVATGGVFRPSRPIAVLDHDTWGDYCAAYTTAQLRAYGQAGHMNRRERRYWRERAQGGI